MIASLEDIRQLGYDITPCGGSGLCSKDGCANFITYGKDCRGHTNPPSLGIINQLLKNNDWSHKVFHSKVRQYQYNCHIDVSESDTDTDTETDTVIESEVAPEDDAVTLPPDTNMNNRIKT